MDYMKNFFETQAKIYENFQDNFSNLFQQKKQNPMEDFLEMQRNFLTQNPMEFYQKLMENPGFSTDAYKNFLDMQKFYMDNFQKYSDFYKPFQDQNFMPFDFKNMQDAFNQYQNFYSNYDLSKMMNPQMSQVMTRIFDANKFYLELYDFWNKMNQDFLDSVEVDSEKLKKFLEENANKTYEIMSSVLPQELKVFFGGTKQVMEQYFETSASFFGPWKNEFNQLKDLFFKGHMENDPEKLTDFFKLWKEQYDQTFGRLLASPALGISREQVEQQNKMIDTMIKVTIKSAEFASNLNTAQNDAFQKILQEYLTMAKEGAELKTFEEFFAFYTKNMDKNLEEYFATPEFAGLLAQFGEAFMDLKIEYNKLIELALADTPLVTVGKIDSMIEKIYKLQKEVKALKKEVDQLKAEKAEK